MSLAGKLISFVSKRSARRFEVATKDPVRVQTEKILALVAKNADTEYGKKYGFASIQSVADYQRQVPVVTYEDIRSDMERVVNGERRIFTAEDPVMFAQTSGTTGTPKYVPVTPTCQGREHSDQMRTWLYHSSQVHRDMFDGKIVSLVSPAIEGYAPSGLPFGSTSGHIYKNMPGIVRKAYSVPYEVFEISDYEAKYYAIMRISLEHDVRFIATANPSSMLKLCEKAKDFSEDLIKDIHDGTLLKTLEVESEIRASLEQGLRANPQRAKALEEARGRRAGGLKPVDYWPRVSLIGCWKGGTVGHYLDKFDDWFNPDGRRSVPVRDWGYLSSEARGSIPLSDEGSKGALTVATNFFEFVPVDDLAANPDDSSAWTFLTVGDLEMDKEYYIFVTTTGGLYRYDINDVIQVAGRYNETPEIVFLRKGRGMTNITGEKLSVNQVIEAFQQVSPETGAIVDHFKAEADTENSRYVFKAEFVGPVEEALQRTLLAGLDDYLKKVNIEYKAKRDSGRLRAPILQVMRAGWYERNRRQQVAGGGRAFQAKTELLSPVKADTEAMRPELENVVEMED